MGETETKERYKTLSNGAVYDMERKRIVSNPGGGTYAITPENSSAYHARRAELKREAIARGANAVVAEGGKFDGSDLDFVEAIAEAQAIKALNPDDPKSTDAARFLLQEAGLSEKQAQTPVSDALDSLSGLVRELAALAASLPDASDNYNYRKHDIVDGDARDADDESDEKKQE